MRRIYEFCTTYKEQGKNTRNERRTKEKWNERLFVVHVPELTSGLRISDIIKLQVKDVLNLDRTMKTHIEIVEQKTNKTKRFKINSALAEELYQFIKDMGMSEFIFKSRNGNNKHITRVRAYTILNEAAKKVGLSDIGTHTLRKTFGYFFYQQSKDVALLQQLFNHSSPSITLRYIRNQPRYNG